MRAIPIVMLCAMLLPLHAPAKDTDAAPRYRLAHAQAEAAPQRGARYTLRARWAPAETTGDLREGDNFVLLGRWNKAALCGPFTAAIFRNGFEN